MAKFKNIGKSFVGNPPTGALVKPEETKTTTAMVDSAAPGKKIRIGQRAVRATNQKVNVGIDVSGGTRRLVSFIVILFVLVGLQVALLFSLLFLSPSLLNR